MTAEERQLGAGLGRQRDALIMAHERLVELAGPRILEDIGADLAEDASIWKYIFHNDQTIGEVSRYPRTAHFKRFYVNIDDSILHVHRALDHEPLRLPRPLMERFGRFLVVAGRESAVNPRFRYIHNERNTAVNLLGILFENYHPEMSQELVDMTIRLGLEVTRFEEENKPAAWFSMPLPFVRVLNQAVMSDRIFSA